MLMVAVVFWIVFSILLVRLGQLTVVNGFAYRTLSDSNRTRELIRHAPRGTIRDRQGKPLAENVSRYVLLSPCESQPETICKKIISKEEGDQLQANGLGAHTFLEASYGRQYPADMATAHIVGYVGEISTEELADSYYTLRKYRSGDYLGRIGSEALYEPELRGRDGRELVEVDANGTSVRVLGRDAEIAGDDVYISIDRDLSQVAYDSFPKEFPGSVVVLKPSTGEVLTMLSQPTFSSQRFANGLSPVEYERLIEDPQNPLLNRAIGGNYPPASTFKLISGTAGLETGAFTALTEIEDIGVIRINQFEFPNWYFLKYGKTEGLVNLRKALARSNDIYFYRLGEVIGISQLYDWGRLFGLGEPTGIELPGEVGGLMPNPEWKNKHFSSAEDKLLRHNEWYLGDTYHASIGQGYILATPLQVASYTSVFANHEPRRCTPTIRYIGLAEKQPACPEIPISSTTHQAIVDGMLAACHDGGTAYPLFNVQVGEGESLRSIPIACKTGTAEFGDPQNDTHAWITAFAPVPKAWLDHANIPVTDTMVTGEPELVVTVLVEGAGEGSDKAAPIAASLFRHWFSR